MPQNNRFFDMVAGWVNPYEATTLGVLPDLQFYKDVVGRLGQAFTGGVQDVFKTPDRWKDPNWTLRGMEADAWKNNPAGELNRVMAGPMGLAPLGITAFHGSQHKFDKFDASKIGTGEGSQAYGHGLYMAENPEVAKSYQFAGRAAYTNNQAAEKAYRALEVSNGDAVAAKAWLHKRGMEAPPEMRQQYFDAMNNFDSFKSTANLYKVDIPDEMIPKMLDWDKPLSQQPESVKSAMRTFFGERRFQQAISEHKFPHDILPNQGTKEAKFFTEAMQGYGIPGIRYLDQGSRAGGNGTSNYVVFPGVEKQLKILGRE